MSSNKKAREELEKRYGSECFIEKLHLRKDTEPRKYKSKNQMKKMNQLSYHHIKMKKDGGKATVENGALLSLENHAWFHKQDESTQGYLNAIFQEHKRQVDDCTIKFVDFIETPYKICPLEINVGEKSKDNRTKKKQESKKTIKESEEEER